MATDESQRRVPVKAYVPEHVKAEWEAHAETIGARSLSEYVQMMVDAGRREIDPHEEHAGSSAAVDADPGGGGYKDRILAVLREDPHLSWDELVERLTEDLEGEIDEALSELQDENAVRYAGRHGGYEVVE